MLEIRVLPDFAYVATESDESVVPTLGPDPGDDSEACARQRARDG